MLYRFNQINDKHLDKLQFVKQIILLVYIELLFIIRELSSIITLYSTLTRF